MRYTEARAFTTMRVIIILDTYYERSYSSLSNDMFYILIGREFREIMNLK